MIRVFIGFDQVESVAWSVFNYSLQRRASAPVQVAPLKLSQLAPFFNRPWDTKQTNAFSFTRWLVPYLCDYQGWALFADCDILCRADIAELWALRDERYAVQCVQHRYTPAEQTKYLGRPQTAYARKNWSSVMLMNCARCKRLTPEYVNHASGLELHQFDWLSSDTLIGRLPSEWNHLVGVHDPNPDAKLAHFTLGGPYFHRYTQCEFTSEWFRELWAMLYCAQDIDEPAL